jgi:Lar family restriction alleviation protein
MEKKEKEKKGSAPKLLPCPFCGNTEISIPPQGEEILYIVSCPCGAETPKNSFTREGAAKIWNRRRWWPGKED